MTGAGSILICIGLFIALFVIINEELSGRKKK